MLNLKNIWYSTLYLMYIILDIYEKYIWNIKWSFIYNLKILYEYLLYIIYYILYILYIIYYVFYIYITYLIV